MTHPGSHLALAQRRVAVLGLGEFGVAAAGALASLGAVVTAVGVLSEPLDGVRAASAGRLPDGIDLVVVSAEQVTSPLLDEAAELGLEVWGEAELAWRLRGPGAAQWLVVTGEVGRTTAVEMLDAMLRSAGLRSAVVGAGGSLVAAVGTAAYDVLAVELSAAQLHGAASLEPLAAAVLDLAGASSPALLTPGTVAVGNADDVHASALLAGVDAQRTVTFTLQSPRIGQVGVVEELLVDRAFVEDPVHGAAELATLDDILLPGSQPVVAALAAAALARAYGVSTDDVRDGLRLHSASTGQSPP